MAKEKTLFSCSECGGNSPKWLGKCPHCESWNTLVETVEQSASGSKNRYQNMGALAPASPVSTLSDIKATDVDRTPTGLEELDRVPVWFKVAWF